MASRPRATRFWRCRSAVWGTQLEMLGGFFRTLQATLAISRWMGVSKNRGTPKWMVYFMENPMNKFMIWGGGGGTIIFGSTPIKMDEETHFFPHSFDRGISTENSQDLGLGGKNMNTSRARLGVFVLGPGNEFVHLVSLSFRNIYSNIGMFCFNDFQIS